MVSDSDSKGVKDPLKVVVPGRRKPRRALRVLGVVLLLLLVVIAAAPTIAGSLARRQIAMVASEALEADVTIGDLSLGWLSGVAVSDISVAPRKAGKPDIRVGSIVAKPTLGALLSGSVQVPDLVIKHVTVNLAKGADEVEEEEDEEAADREEASKPAASVPDFGIAATIEDVTIVYSSPGWPHPIRVERIGPVVIKASSRDATHVDVVVGPSVKASIDVLWAKDGKRVRRRERSILGEVIFDRADLKGFEGATAPWLSALRGIADGAIRFHTAGKSMTSSGNLHIAGATLTQTGAVDDHVLRDLVLKHDVARGAGGTEWSGVISIAAADGRIAPFSALGRPLAVARLDLEAALSSNMRVDVKRLSMAADFGRVDATGSVTTGKEPFSASADLEARAAMQQIAPWVGGLPDLSGELTSKVKIVVAPDGLISVRGTTALENFVAQGVRGVGALREREVLFRHDLDFGAGTLKIHQVELKSSFATARCAGALVPRSDGAPPEGQVDVSLDADLDIISGLLGENVTIHPKGRVGIAGKLAGEATGTSFDVRLSGSKVALEGGPFVVGPLVLGDIAGGARGTLSADRSRLSVPQWSVRARVLDASGSAEASGLRDAHPKVTAAIAATAEPDLVLAALSATPRPRPIGRIQLAANLSGTDAAWVVDVTKLGGAGIQGAGAATFPHADVPSGAPTFQARLSGALGDVVALVATDVVATGNFRADVSGRLGVRPTLDATVHGEALRIQASPGGSVISGNALIGAKADTGGAFEARITSPALTFTHSKRKSVTGEVKVIAKGTWDGAGKVLDVTSLSATGPGAAMTGTARVEMDEAATFDLKADLTMAQAAPLLAFAAPSLSASGTGTLRTHGRMSLQDAGMRESQADIALVVDGLKTDALDLKNVQLDAALEGGVAKTRKATATLNGGSAVLDATWDFRPEVPAWRGNARFADVQITKEMQPAIARAIPIFAGVAVTVNGVMHATLDLDGRGATWEEIKPTLTGTGVVGAKGAKVSQSEMLEVIGQFIGVPKTLAFQDFETRFQIQNGAVRQERLLLSSDQIDMKMSGTTSLEGRLNYDLGIKPKGRSVDEQWSRLGAALDREGFLAMRLAGDVSKPSLKPPKIEKLVGGAVEDLLKGGLDDLLKKKKKKKEED